MDESELDSLDRLRRGVFYLPEEAEGLIQHFSSAMVQALEVGPEYWELQLTSEESLDCPPEDSWSPEDFQKHIRPRILGVYYARVRLNNMLTSLHALAAQFGIDDRPLLQFGRYIDNGEPLTDSDKRAVRDCVSLLGLRISATSKQKQERDDESAKFLVKVDAAVLACLAEKWPVGQTLDDIAIHGNMSKATAKASVDRLLKFGYADRPCGPNKGAVITAAGQEVANKLSTK